MVAGANSKNAAVGRTGAWSGPHLRHLAALVLPHCQPAADSVLYGYGPVLYSGPEDRLRLLRTGRSAGAENVGPRFLDAGAGRSRDYRIVSQAKQARVRNRIK